MKHNVPVISYSDYTVDYLRTVFYRSSEHIQEEDPPSDGEMCTKMQQAIRGQTHPQTQTQTNILQTQMLK